MKHERPRVVRHEFFRSLVIFRGKNARRRGAVLLCYSRKNCAHAERRKQGNSKQERWHGKPKSHWVPRWHRAIAWAAIPDRLDAVASRLRGIQVKQLADLPRRRARHENTFLSTICLRVGDCTRGGNDAEAKRQVHR